MEKRMVSQKDISASDSPYSPAVICGELVFISGQVPIDSNTKVIVADDFEQQVEQVFCNLKNILHEVGSSLEKVVKTTVFLTSLDDFPLLNEVYMRQFFKDRPARSCVEISRLPFGAKVEIEAIAII